MRFSLRESQLKEGRRMGLTVFGLILLPFVYFIFFYLPSRLLDSRMGRVRQSV